MKLMYLITDRVALSMSDGDRLKLSESPMDSRTRVLIYSIVIHMISSNLASFADKSLIISSCFLSTCAEVGEWNKNRIFDNASDKAKRTPSKILSFSITYGAGTRLLILIATLRHMTSTKASISDMVSWINCAYWNGSRCSHSRPQGLLCPQRCWAGPGSRDPGRATPTPGQADALRDFSESPDPALCRESMLQRHCAIS